MAAGSWDAPSIVLFPSRQNTIARYAKADPSQCSPPAFHFQTASDDDWGFVVA